jgi:hypothetical protein
MRNLQVPSFLLGKPFHGVHDDFLHYVTGDDFSTVASDSGTIADSDAVGGVLALEPSDGTITNNDETYLKSTQETFKFAVDKPMYYDSLIQFTEGNTDDANVISGFKDAVAADTLVDDGGGPPSSYHGCVFYKVDGGTKWIFETSMGATQVTNTTDATAGGSAYQRLTIEVKENGGYIEVTPYIDGVQCRDNTSGDLIHHRVAIASATEMQVCIGMKNGADTTNEGLLIDYVTCLQLR